MTYYPPVGHHRAFLVDLNGTDLQIIESYSNIGKPEIGQIVSPNDVITGDGVRRDVIVINGKYPGPMIEVMENTQVLALLRHKIKIPKLYFVKKI